jgi:ubiquinone/menaquinone biosynthesis C-methylase UbiE
MEPNRLTSAIEEHIALNAPARRLRLALASRVLERQFGGRPARVLDAGCGDGLLSLALARRHPEWHVTGVDISDDLLSVARRRAKRQTIDNVTFRRGDLTRPLEDADYDVVLALECLTEIPDDEAALRVFADALRPGGMCAVQVPERTWTPVLRRSEPTWRHEVRHGYGREDLRTALAGAGLERIAIDPTYRGTATLAQELRDRTKHGRLAIRTLAFPVFAGATVLEQKGITWGRGRALFAVAWKGHEGA